MYVNEKMRPVETVPGRGDKEWWRGSMQLWYILRTFVNVVSAAMFSQYNNNKKKRKKE
jgi:hypothetical protein